MRSQAAADVEGRDEGLRNDLFCFDLVRDVALRVPVISS